MGIVKDVMGYRINDEIVCTECITDDESKEVTQEEIITLEELQSTDDTFFCDRCKKRLY